VARDDLRARVPGATTIRHARSLGTPSVHGGHATTVKIGQIIHNMDDTSLIGFIFALLVLALGLWLWKITEVIQLLKEIRDHTRALARQDEYLPTGRRS
jgi:hypothetical protein